jgi:NAD(P)-dependent dehydrogenase (short-subunit alcohol dehydrogenase family)
VLADSATLKWPGLFVQRYRFPRVVDGFLVPAAAEPLIACNIGVRQSSRNVRLVGAWLTAACGVETCSSPARRHLTNCAGTRLWEHVAAGHQAIGVRCNVADEAEVAAMVEQTVSTFDRLDAAYNNAGVHSTA